MDETQVGRHERLLAAVEERPHQTVRKGQVQRPCGESLPCGLLGVKASVSRQDRGFTQVFASTSCCGAARAHLASRVFRALR